MCVRVGVLVQRLGLFLVVDAPTLFSVLWQAISAFVDKKTYTKIRYADNSSMSKQDDPSRARAAACRTSEA